MQELKNIIELLDKSIHDEPNNLITQWNIIKNWFNNEIDEYRDFINNAHDWLNNYTKKLIDETLINTLKIKYTNSLWYFIEVSLSNKSKVPDYFILKSTLINSIRYTTEELMSFDEKISNAESVLFQKEYEIFNQVCDELSNSFKYLKSISKNTWNLDFLSNLAEVAYKNNYVKPEIHDWYELEIKEWRHPVIEKIEKKFINNDLNLSSKNFVNILTWPNMWWKSTYLRQNALIILMSHIWSFVPASFAKIPLTDKIFSRIWANDNLFLWNSTFMVEMQEVANILNNSTKNSFVIIDEVWRGTSTYDWMSLAWAILKQNHDNIKAKTLFATHYHELVDESKKLKWVSNFSVAVWENDSWIVFLRKIVPWSIKKSYWIEVAKLAWLPKSVILEANNFLNNYENNHKSNQMSLWNIWLDYEKVIEKVVYQEVSSDLDLKIKDLDLNNLTPIEALNLLIEFKNNLK